MTKSPPRVARDGSMWPDPEERFAQELKEPSTSDAEEMEKAFQDADGTNDFTYFESGWKAATTRADKVKTIAVGMQALATDVIRAQLNEAKVEIADLKARLAEPLAASDVGSEFICPKCGTKGNCASQEASEEPGFCICPNCNKYWSWVDAKAISSLPADEIAKHPLVRELMEGLNLAGCQHSRIGDPCWHFLNEKPCCVCKALAPFRKGGQP